MKKVKLFEEFQDDIKKWTKKIVNDERFHKWFDKNKDSSELKGGYKKYLSNIDDKDALSFKNWSKEYYDNL